jgi:hypothetical protein
MLTRMGKGSAFGWLFALAIGGLLFTLILASQQVTAAPTPPVILQVSPDHVYNDQPTVITITGAGFVATPLVTLESCEVSRKVLTDVTYLNQTLLTATVPAGIPESNYHLQVINPDGQAQYYHDFIVIRPGDSVLSSWQATTSMIQQRSSLAAVAAGDYLYALGNGMVERAHIQADGSLEPWQISSTMRKARVDFAAVVVGHYLYALGGNRGDIGDLADATVERAEIYSDGTLGEWQLISTMINPRSGLAAVAADGYLYAIGGFPGNGPALTSVEWTPINADGTLGPWQLTTSTVKIRNRAVAAHGYLYAPAGFGDRFIERAKIQPNGSLSSWSIITSTMTTGRTDYGLVATPHALFAIGNFLPCIRPFPSVEWAPVNVDGTVGAWQQTASLTTPRYDHATVVVGNYLYALGGEESGSTQHPSSVEYAIVQQQATQPYTLTVNKSGSGRVTGNPGNIGCSGAAPCTASQPYEPQTVIMLTATAAPGSIFTGWSGACNGIRVCQVTLNTTQAVTATFQIAEKFYLPIVY